MLDPDENAPLTTGTSRHVQELTERAVAIGSLTDNDHGDNVSVAIVPAGHGIALLDSERLYADSHPAARRGEAQVDEIEPFTRYVNSHADDFTTVWLRHDPDTLGKTEKPIGSVVAVLDDHHHRRAGWGEHRAVLHLRTTPTWRHWLAVDGQWLNQDDFSEHLRQGLPSIIEPDAATVLEICEHLTITATETLGQTIRRGGQINVEHKIDTTATSHRASSESTEIPEVFRLSVAPFLGSGTVELEARLKYRNRGGQLALGYVLVRPLEVLRDAFDRVEHELKQTLNGDLHTRIYRGTPITAEGRKQRIAEPKVTTAVWGGGGPPPRGAPPPRDPRARSTALGARRPAPGPAATHLSRSENR